MPRQNHLRMFDKNVAQLNSSQRHTQTSSLYVKPLFHSILNQNNVKLSAKYHWHIPEPIPQLPVLQRMSPSEWSLQDQRKLFRLHDQLGNRWTFISLQFTNLSDNAVKNHIFSRLRMALRYLNKVISESKITPKCKMLKMHIFYKIMGVCQQRFKSESVFTQDFIFFSRVLKNNILNYLSHKNQKQYITNIIKEIQRFRYLLKNKRFSRLHSLNGEINIEKDEYFGGDEIEVKDRNIQLQLKQTAKLQNRQSVLSTGLPQTVESLNQLDADLQQMKQQKIFDCLIQNHKFTASNAFSWLQNQNISQKIKFADYQQFDPQYEVNESQQEINIRNNDYEYVEYQIHQELQSEFCL